VHERDDQVELLPGAAGQRPGARAAVLGEPELFQQLLAVAEIREMVCPARTTRFAPASTS